MEIQPILPGPADAGQRRDPIAPPPPMKAEKGSAPESVPGHVESEQVKKMVEEITQHLHSMNVSLDFTPYGEKGEKMAVIVSDKDTGEVIREIPSKELQNLYMKMNELIGIIFNRHI